MTIQEAVDSFNRLEHQLEVLDKLSEAEAKHLLKMLLTNLLGSIDAATKRTEGRS